jgi:hypothetical protein
MDVAAINALLYSFDIGCSSTLFDRLGTALDPRVSMYRSTPAERVRPSETSRSDSLYEALVARPHLDSQSSLQTTRRAEGHRQSEHHAEQTWALA